MAQRVFRRPVRKLARNSDVYSPWAMQTVVHNGWPRKCVFYGAGGGDDLLCTTIAWELRKSDRAVGFPSSTGPASAGGVR